MPLYLKRHSQGEYVFDWSWADAYERAGGQYTPNCNPPPVLAGHRPRPDRWRPGQAGAARRLWNSANRIGASGVHITFPAEDDWRLLGQQGLLQRQDKQFHWSNQGYETFG